MIRSQSQMHPDSRRKLQPQDPEHQQQQHLTMSTEEHIAQLTAQIIVRIGETGEKCTSRARDAASATQAEHCALHHMCVPYLLDRGLAVLRRRKGGDLVDICTSCI